MGHKHSASTRRVSSLRRSDDWRNSICDDAALRHYTVREMAEKSYRSGTEQIEELLRR